MQRIHFDPRNLGELDFDLLQYLNESLKDDGYWSTYLSKALGSEVRSTATVHLAIFVEPYLQFLLEGKKTIESRFSINKCAPYNKVAKGDILLIKKSGGPVVAVCTIKERWYYKLNPKSWIEIKQYQEALCANDPDFWEMRKDATFATLIKIDNLRKINPLEFDKKDRRGWVVITENAAQYSLL